MPEDIPESKFKFFSSIGFSVLVFVLILMGFIAIILHTSFSSYKFSKDISEKNKRQAVIDISVSIKNKIDNEKAFLTATAEAIDSMIRSGNEISEIHEYLRNVSKYKVTISNPDGVFAYVNGHFLSGADKPLPEDFNINYQAWYTAAVNAFSLEKGDIGSVMAIEPYLDPVSKKVVTSLSVVLSDHKSVVCMNLPVEDFQRIIDQLGISDNCFGFVVHRRGFIGAHINRPKPSKITHKLSLELLKTKPGVGEDINSIYDFEHHEEIFKTIKYAFNHSQYSTFETKHENNRITMGCTKIYNDWCVLLIQDRYIVNARNRVLLVSNCIFAIFILSIVSYFTLSSFIYKRKMLKYAAALRVNEQLLEGKVREQNSTILQQAHDMIEMQNGVIEGIASLIESRDGNTGAHVKNTRFYSTLLAEYLYEHGLHKDEVNEEFVQMMGNAAVLHDIGKIMISDTILNKSGKLTNLEYKVMQTHAEIGGQIAKDILGDYVSSAQVKITSEVAHYHHEKWNGHGYPEGLKGEQIPIAARILAIADVFDALASNRVYKDAFPVEKVFEIIASESGKHFDPELLKIFLSLRPQIELYLESL